MIEVLAVLTVTTNCAGFIVIVTGLAKLVQKGCPQ